MSRQQDEWEDYFNGNDRWQTYPAEGEYSYKKRQCLKRLRCGLAAVLIFAICYCLHISQTSLGSWSDAAVHYTVDSWLDYEELIERSQPFAAWLEKNLSGVVAVTKQQTGRSVNDVSGDDKRNED